MIQLTATTRYYLNYGDTKSRYLKFSTLGALYVGFVLFSELFTNQNIVQDSNFANIMHLSLIELRKKNKDGLGGRGGGDLKLRIYPRTSPR